MKKIDSLRKIGRLGNFLRLAVAPWLVLGPATPAMAWGDHKQKVLVPVVPVYTAPASSAAMAPVVSYSYGTGAGAPVAMAPGSGVISGVYYAPTAGTQFGMASATYAYPNTVSAPQLINPGASFAPTASTSFGNVPVKIGDSRVTDEGRKDVLADLKDYYQESKTSEKSRTTLRKALKDQAKEKYVEVIGGEVASVDDLKDSEKKEIDQIVNIVMREDSPSNASSPPGYPNPYPYPYAYGNGFAPQPMYYYYVYPVVPAGHQHHHFHHNH